MGTEAVIKKETDTMTEGPILKKIVRFAIPLILTGILQQLYNAVDSVVIGKFSSSLALAAVGGSGSLIHLVINLFIGLSLGASIVMAQCFGADDQKGMRKTVNTSIALALVCGVILTAVGLAVLKPILILIETPADVMPYSVKYLTIYFCGIIPTLVYNFLTGILNATGDSRRPLFYLAISALLNVVLNLIFVLIFKMDVEGVAIATIISQTVCCIMALYRLTTIQAPYKIKIREIGFDKSFLVKILKLGIPSGINASLFSFSNLLIQSTINTFGSAAMAGCAADSNIENFIYMTMNSTASASTTFVSQNKGAGKYDRITKGVRCALALVTAMGLTLGISTYLMGEKLLYFFTDDPVVVQYGMERMVIVALLYFLCGIMDVLSGAIRGHGISVVPMLVSIFGVCGIRILWIYTVLPFFRSITMLYVAYPLSWLITAAVLYMYYRRLRRKNLSPVLE